MKKIVFVATITIAGLVLNGCGSSGDTGSSDGAGDTSSLQQNNPDSSGSKGEDDTSSVSENVKLYGIENPTELQKRVFRVINDFRSKEETCGSKGAFPAVPQVKYSEVMNIASEKVAGKVVKGIFDDFSKDEKSRLVGKHVLNEVQNMLYYPENIGVTLVDFQREEGEPLIRNEDIDVIVSELETRLKNPQNEDEEGACALAMGDYDKLGFGFFTNDVNRSVMVVSYSQE